MYVPCGWGYGYPYWGWYDSSYYYPTTNPYVPLTDQARQYDPQLLPPLPQAAVLSPEEIALIALQQNRWTDAIAALSQVISSASAAAAPSAASPAPLQATNSPIMIPAPEARRLLAVALLGDKRPAEAARALADAYGADESLTLRPLNAAIVGGNETLRSLVVQSVRFAQKTQTTNNWFIVAVLMQAQGRTQLPDRVAEGVKHHRLAAKLFPTAATPAKP